MTLRSTNVSQNHQLKYFNPLDSKCNYSANIEQYKVGTLAVDRWAVTFGIQQVEDWAGCGPAQSPPRCTKCNSPPINGQCTNHCTAICYIVASRNCRRPFIWLCWAKALEQSPWWHYIGFIAVSFQKKTENSLISAILSGHYFVVCYGFLSPSWSLKLFLLLRPR